MATKRSPILGYNHNFRHRGRVFHVQTEDSGVDNPHVFTHMFHGGVILSSRKLDYDREASEEAVKALMQAQHKAMLRDLKKGTFDEKIVSYLGPHPDDAMDLPSGHVPAAPAEAAPEAALIADTEPTPAPTPPAEPAAAPRARVTPPPDPPPVTVEFTKSEASEPVEIHQTAPDEPGHVHSPAPASAPVPPGASTYIQRGNVRREAPLVNTGQMAAVMEPGDVRGQHGDRESGRQQAVPAPVERGGSASAPPIPTPAARRSPRPAAAPSTRSPAVPAPAPRPAPSSTRAPAARPSPSSTRGPGVTPSAPEPTGRRPASARAATQPREQSGSGVVVSRPSVIVGAPPKVVGGEAARSTGTPARAARSTATPPQSKPVRSRARSAREEAPQDSVFGSDLISEKSLDEVILAYLSEDPADD